MGRVNAKVCGGGEFSDDELYPSDAQWAGLCDRMTSHTPEELQRRQELAALSASAETVVMRMAATERKERKA